MKVLSIYEMDTESSYGSCDAYVSKGIPKKEFLEDLSLNHYRTVAVREKWSQEKTHEVLKRITGR